MSVLCIKIRRSYPLTDAFVLRQVYAVRPPIRSGRSVDIDANNPSNMINDWMVSGKMHEVQRIMVINEEDHKRET